MHITEIIKELLVDDDRSQSWLSRKTGISKAKISKFLNGKGWLYANELILILLSLKISLVDNKDMTVLREEDYEDNKLMYPEEKTPEESGGTGPVVNKPNNDGTDTVADQQPTEQPDDAIIPDGGDVKKEEVN